MKIQSFIFVLLMFCGVCFAAPFRSDGIDVILEESINNQPTGNYLHLNIVIYTNDTGTHFGMSQEWLRMDDEEKATTLSMTYCESYDKFNSAIMKDVKWIPGRKFSCVYTPMGGNSVNLIVTRKVGGGDRDWEVDGKGFFKMIETDPEKRWELKSTKNVQLKYSKLKLENLYW